MKSKLCVCRERERERESERFCIKPVGEIELTHFVWSEKRNGGGAGGGCHVCQCHPF